MHDLNTQIADEMIRCSVKNCNKEIKKSEAVKIQEDKYVCRDCWRIYFTQSFGV